MTGKNFNDFSEKDRKAFMKMYIKARDGGLDGYVKLPLVNMVFVNKKK